MIRGCDQDSHSGVKVNWERSVRVCTPEAETRRRGVAGACAGSRAHRGSAALNIYCSRLAFRFLCSHLERGRSAHQIIPRNTLPLLVYLCPFSLCFPVFARVVKATGAHERGKPECVLLLLGRTWPACFWPSVLLSASSILLWGLYLHAVRCFWSGISRSGPGPVHQRRSLRDQKPPASTGGHMGRVGGSQLYSGIRFIEFELLYDRMLFHRMFESVLSSLTPDFPADNRDRSSDAGRQTCLWDCATCKTTQRQMMTNASLLVCAAKCR